ncbi:MAG: aldo/keto reductase [Pseudomonadota bacterium]|nr:aldo/keto reductase [Pseudomonadota bacterium]
MTLRTLAGHQVHPIGLGCMSLSHAYGHPPSEAEGIRLVHQALDMGYIHLDTARLYGLGRNELLLGKALKGRREGVLLASKCGIVIDGETRRIDGRPETIRAAVETSLQSLQTDRIDLYYLHRRDFDTPIEESVGALAELVRDGKIGAIGLSEMSADTLRRAHAEHPVAAMQTEYSLWSRNAEIAVLDACRELGVAFVAFSPVARGVFAGAIRDPESLTENDLRRGQPRFSAEHWPANLALVDRFNAIASQLGMAPAQLSLAWLLSRGPHVHAIPGTTNSAHLAENVSAAGLAVPQTVLDRLDTLVNRDTVSGPRYSPAMQRTIDTEEFA